MVLLLYIVLGKIDSRPYQNDKQVHVLNLVIGYSLTEVISVTSISRFKLKWKYIEQDAAKDILMPMISFWGQLIVKIILFITLMRGFKDCVPVFADRWKERISRTSQWNLSPALPQPCEYTLNLNRFYYAWNDLNFFVYMIFLNILNCLNIKGCRDQIFIPLSLIRSRRHMSIDVSIITNKSCLSSL